MFSRSHFILKFLNRQTKRFVNNTSTSFNLSDRIAIITGSGSGIGRETAKLLSSKGCIVNCIDINNTGLQSLKKDIISNNGVCNIYVGDVSNAEFVEHYIDSIFKEYKSLDILCNIAGIEGHDAMKPFHEHSLDNINNVLQINLMSAIINCKLAIPKMLQTAENNMQKDNINYSASIINTTSDVTEQIVAGMSDYTISKYGIIGLTKCIATEYGASNIRCNIVRPGGTDTQLLKRVFSTNNISPDDAVKRSIIPRLCTVEEVAQFYLWLASSDTRYVNGTEFGIDGGMTLTKQHYPSMLNNHKDK
eukprot:503356_1